MRVTDDMKTVTITANDVKFLENWRTNDGHEQDSIFDALSSMRDNASLGNAGKADQSLQALKNANKIVIGTADGHDEKFALSDGFFHEPAKEFRSPGMSGPAVEIEPSVTSVGTSAFYGFKMDSVKIVGPAGLRPVAIGGYAFASSDLRAFESEVPLDLSRRSFCDNEKLKDVRFKDYVGSIPDNCFADCPNLASVSFGRADTELPEYLCGDDFALSIGEGAFEDCGKLSEFKLSDGVYVSDVGVSAFQGDSRLGSIDLSNATSVGRYAFYDSNLDIEASHVGNLKHVESCAFIGCRCPESLTFSPDADVSEDAFPSGVSVNYYRDDAKFAALRESAAMFDLEGADLAGHDKSTTRKQMPSDWEDLDWDYTPDDHEDSPAD